MGEGNPNQPRGTGRGTKNFWRGVGLEGPAELQPQKNQKIRRNQLLDGMIDDEKSPEERDGILAPEEIPENKNSHDQIIGDETKKANFPIYRSGPTPETAGKKLITIEKVDEAGLSEDERKKLNTYIQSTVKQFNFAEYIGEEYSDLSEEDGEEIKKLIYEEIEQIAKEIISYLIKEYGEESVRKSILDDKLPELELFQEKIHNIIQFYYLEYIDALDLQDIRREEETTRQKLQREIGGIIALENENRVADVLEKIGCHVTKKDVKKIIERLNQSAESINGKIADLLIEKNGSEKVDTALKIENGFLYIFNETADEIEEIVGDEAKKYYHQVLEEKKSRGSLTPDQQGNGIIVEQSLSEGRKTPVGHALLEMDKSGDNSERKEARKMIYEKLQDAVKEMVERINAAITQTEDRETKKKLQREKIKIKKEVLKNIEAFVGPMLQYLMDNLKNQQKEQLIVVEARRIVANAFTNSELLRQILPNGKISRDLDANSAEPATAKNAPVNPFIGSKAVESLPSKPQEIDFSKYKGALSEKLIKKLEKLSGIQWEETAELLKTWGFVSNNLSESRKELMENGLEEATMKVFRENLKIEKSKEGFDSQKFIEYFLNELEIVLRRSREKINKRDVLDLFRMYFEQAFLIETIK